MADVVSKKKRSEIMSRVKSRDSKIEIVFRKALWNRGFRYSKNSSKYFGKPDLILKKYKTVIFIDSCFWHGCKKHFRLPATNKKYWDEKIKNAKICIPEMVINERIAQLLQRIEEIKDKINNNYKKFEVFKVKIDNDYKKKDYKKILIEHKDKIIKDNKFEVLKYPSCSIDEISERAINKIPPFKNSEKGDNGYKDKIIWKSIIEDAQKNKDTNYILVTKNIKDFKHECLEEEFKDVSSANLSIVEDVPQLKEFFDKELNLKLDLEKLHKEILNKILTHSGEIIFDIHKGRYSYDFGSLIGASAVYMAQYRLGERGKLVGFNPLKYDLENLNTKDSDIYKVDLIIEGQGVIRKKEGQKKSYDVGEGGFSYDHAHHDDLTNWAKQAAVSFGIPSASENIKEKEDDKYSYSKQKVIFAIEIEYNSKKDKIESIEIYPGAPLESDSSVLSWGPEQGLISV